MQHTPPRDIINAKKIILKQRPLLCTYLSNILFPGEPEGSTDSGSGFKAPQKTGPQLKGLIRQTGRSQESNL